MSAATEQQQPYHAIQAHAHMVFRPFLFLATIFATFVVMMGESNIPQYIKYTTVTGFFQQDDPATDPNGFDYVRSPEITAGRRN